MTGDSESTKPQKNGEASGTKPPLRLPVFLTAPLIPAVLVVLLTLAVYWQILGFSFVNYDDGTNVFQNPHLNPVTARGLAYLWTHGYYELYMPVTYTIWGICASLFRPTQGIYVLDAGNVSVNPAAFHAFSLFLHSTNTLLVFLLLSRIVKKPWAAGSGALIFALHPVQVESVAWVTGMNNLTSGFFGLLALSLYLAAAEEDTDNTRLSPLKYGAATLFFVLALLSKPTAAALPLVAMALNWGVLGRPPKRWFKLLAFWVVLSLAIAVITSLTSETSQKLHLALWARPFIAGDALAYYLSKLFFPVNLSLLNAGRSMSLVQSSWWGYATWLLPLAVGLLIGRAGPEARLLKTGALVFVLAVLPMLGFVVFYAMADTTVSSRYLYLSLLGIGMAAAWFAGNDRIRPAVRVGVSCLYLLFFVVQTLRLIPSWKDSATLASGQVKINPDDSIAQMNSGVFLSEKGKLSEAIPHFQAAAALKPNNAVYHYNLGSALEDSGDLSGALLSLREAVRLNSGYVEAQINLGGVLLKLGQYQEAVETLTRASEIAPNDPSAGYLRGVALARVQRYGEAEVQLRRVLEISPQFSPARQALGKVLQKKGRQNEAAQVPPAAVKGKS